MTNLIPVPATGHVDLWMMSGSPGLDAIRLDPEEEIRAARMATEELQGQARRRRRFLRAVLARYLDLPPDRVPLATDEAGKPVVARDPGLHFNLSHSGDVSVLAVGADPLGIDVERRKAFDRLAELTAYACSPRERAGIAAAADATAAFLDRWVIKEAILKCRGSGLVDNLRDVDPGEVSPSPSLWRGLTLQQLPPPPGAPADLHLALAVAGPPSRTTWRRLHAPPAQNDTVPER